jgi:DNA recombination protein RmuC
MSPVIWIGAGVVAIAIVAVVLRAAGRRSEAQLSAVRQEMQASLAAQSQAVASHLNHMTQSVTQQLGQVRQELLTGVASTGQLTTDAQREMAKQMQSSTNMLLQMSQKIGDIQRSSADLSKATQTLQSVLGSAKTRGTLGEVTLERLLADALPQSAYTAQYRFPSTGAIVDAIVRTGDYVLSIDSKFPLEAYRRLVEEGGDARREFSIAVRKHADSIAEKYILPGEHTFDYALMFVPSEGVYYELLMTEDSKYGMLDEYCRGRRVFPVSPNTFYACLSAVAVSLQGQKIEETARHILANLAGMKKQLDTFADTHAKIGTHLRHAQQCYEDADSKLNRMRNALEQISEGSLAEGMPPLLESAQEK